MSHEPVPVLQVTEFAPVHAATLATLAEQARAVATSLHFRQPGASSMYGHADIVARYLEGLAANVARGAV
jgi:hypothetical protein